MLPVPTIYLEFNVPDNTELAKRDHNRYAKDALRETMEEHHRRHIAKHFTARARYRYGMAERDRKYTKAKQRKYGHTKYLVYSGRNRDRLQSARPQTRIGGAAVGGKKGLTARYSLDLDFPGGKGAQRRTGKPTVSPAQMLRELTRWADEETRWAVEYFHRRYYDKVAAHKRRQKRKRIGARKR